MLVRIALVSALLAADAAGGGEALPGLTLAEAIAEALAANPALIAARLERPITKAGIDVARQRANPDLTLESTRETPRESLALSFPIETAGKRGRRIDLARAAADTGETTIVLAELALRASVRRTYYALCAAQRRLVEVNSLRALAERTHDAAKDRFDSGAAPRLELLQAELALAQTGNDADGAAATLAAARAGLNVVLGRSPEAPTTAAGDLTEGGIPDTEDALRRALAISSEIALADRRLDEQRSRVRLAHAQEIPDFSVQGAVTHDAPGDFDWGWRAGLSLTLPLFHHRRAETRTEELTFDRLSAERSAAIETIRGRIVSASATAAARRRQYLRYRDEILPRGEEVEKMAEDAYRSGQTNLVAMIQAVTAVRDLRGKAIEAGLEYQDALADLEMAMGAPLP